MTIKQTAVKFLFLLTLLFSGFASHAEDKTILIDVRSNEEYQAGHLTDAVLIPYDQIAAQISTVAPDKSQPIELYCRSGRRSEIALKTLQELGYSQVTNIGGYEDLLNKGYSRAVD